MQPLPTIAYGVLSETQLRKKLAELGISNAGNKQLLIRRHTEWRNLVNANCDSSAPKSKRDLLHDLREWEKAQSGGLVNGMAKSKSPSVMEKEFDRGAWSQSHGNEFRDLIAQARVRAKKPEDETQAQNELEPDAKSEVVRMTPMVQIPSALKPLPSSSDSSNEAPGGVNSSYDGRAFVNG